MRVISSHIFSLSAITFTFAICRRLSVCLSSVTFVRPTHTVTCLVTNLRPVVLFKRMRESVIDTYEHVCFP